MRVVLDTNVLVSGLIFSGPPAEILRAWAQRLADSPTSFIDRRRRGVLT